MTLEDIKKQILALIEELNPESKFLTDDPDISAKIDYVINQIQVELARIKKLPKNKTLEVENNQLLNLKDIEDNFYQLNIVRGVNYEVIGDSILFKEKGTANIFYFVLPTMITEANQKSYKMELPTDLLQVLPYGVAGDLLKSDISANYGSIYAKRYEEMLQRIDPRYSVGTIEIGGEDYGF